jgi:hypothetical protein
MTTILKNYKWRSLLALAVLGIFSASFVFMPVLANNNGSNMNLAVPTHISPSNGAVMTTADLNKVDWSDVSATSSPVTYYYEVSYSATTTSTGAFANPIYISGGLTSSEISTAGTPEGTYYWHVSAVDSDGNSSGWSNAWKFTIDNTAPVMPVHLSPANGATTTSAMLQKIDWSDVGDNTAVKYYYQSSHSSATTSSGTFINPVYTSGPLSASEINAVNTPVGTYYWHVMAVDAAGNQSLWTNPWMFTVVPSTGNNGGGNGTTTPPTSPNDKDQCKKEGWRNFTNPTFRNQGECVSHFNKNR